MNKLKKYLDELLDGKGKAIIEKEDVQEMLPALEQFLHDAGCTYSYSENMEGRVLVIIHEVK